VALLGRGYDMRQHPTATTTGGMRTPTALPNAFESSSLRVCEVAVPFARVSLRAYLSPHGSCYSSTFRLPATWGKLFSFDLIFFLHLSLPGASLKGLRACVVDLVITLDGGKRVAKWPCN
jgi:hypothetical protein